MLATLRRTSIAVRMVLLVLLVVGITTTSIGTLSYARAREALEAAARVRLELLARDMARNLQAALTGQLTDLGTWARLEAMLALTYGDVDKELAELLANVIPHRPGYRALAAFDRHGHRVAWAGAPVPERLELQAGTRLRIVAADGSAELVLETAVVNPQRADETIGLLAAFLSPAHLLDAMAGAREGAADAVDVEVVADGVGTILSDRRDGDGEMLLASAAVGTLAPGVDGPRITVQVREPEAVAFASTLALRRTLARIALGVLVLSVGLGGLVAWRISQPIRRLTAAARTVAARGRPEPLVALPETGGEVGVLSAAFAAMLERLAAAQREAIHQSRLALLGEVAASIAHDVRTPLSVLKTSAQLLAGGEVAAGERRELGTMVAAEVDRVNRVVSRLVDLARPQRPRVAPEPLAGLVDETVALLRPWARERGVELETRPGTPGLRVRVDRDQIEQVVLNLLHNAVQAARRRVVLGWCAEPTSALLEVTDDGSGFTSEALARAFTPFFTTKAEGTGLGLAITKRLVEEQGGEVGAENQAGGGARVWLRLPLAAEAA